MEIKEGCTCKGCNAALVLNAERLGKVYRPKTTETVKVVTKYVERKVYQSNPTRDKLYFNAGRYAAGDRDSVAVKANEALNANL